jgi:signal transduction histidine kinase
MTKRATVQVTVVTVRTTPRPPLTKRLRPLHWTVIDYAVGALVGLMVFFTLRPAITVPARGSDGARLLALFLAVGAAIAVARRRKQPLLMLGLLLMGSLLVTVITSGSDGPQNIFLPAAYVLFLFVATSEGRRVLSRVLIAVTAVVILDFVAGMLLGGTGFRGAPQLIPVVLCLTIAWSTGYIVRQRRRYAIGLQVEAASKAVTEERLRIARELHDVVAHSMSVIAVQAGYGQYVIDSQPADAREALSAIQATSREALDEMRRMLGALRSADEAGSSGDGDSELSPGPASGQAANPVGTLAGLFRQVAFVAAPAASAHTASAAPLFPAPGLGDLDRLLSRTAGAGLQVELERQGQVRNLPASIDLSAYRIIQEALTNVVKHAHASRCGVLIDYGDAELTIEVTDSGAGVPVLAGATATWAGGYNALATSVAASAAGGGISGGAVGAAGGHGIIGMRERVSLLGGSFNAGPLPGYGFQVTARIPLPNGANGANGAGAAAGRATGAA